MSSYSEERHVLRSIREKSPAPYTVPPEQQVSIVYSVHDLALISLQDKIQEYTLKVLLCPYLPGYMVDASGIVVVCLGVRSA